jgi:hypothetical protein
MTKEGIRQNKESEATYGKKWRLGDNSAMSYLRSWNDTAWAFRVSSGLFMCLTPHPRNSGTTREDLAITYKIKYKLTFLW